MTDNEIIKSLDCCGNGTKCGNCPHRETGYNCMDNAMNDAAYLIKRQDAELDDLKRDTVPKLQWSLERANKYGMELEKENERLREEIEGLKNDNEYILMQHRFQRRPDGSCWNDVIEKAKANAVREFAERVKELNSQNLLLWDEQIDSLVEEMVGNNNGC